MGILKAQCDKCGVVDDTVKESIHNDGKFYCDYCRSENDLEDEIKDLNKRVEMSKEQLSSDEYFLKDARKKLRELKKERGK